MRFHPLAVCFPAWWAAMLAATAAVPAFALSPGQASPEFTLTATDGKSAKLSDFKGRWVVLEWVNPGCPYVQKHYDSRNMQNLQKEFGGKEVVWLSINSTNKSHYDYLKPAAMGDWMTRYPLCPSS